MCEGIGRHQGHNAETQRERRAWPLRLDLLVGGKVWQRNYYEHIIHNREALERIRAYIQTNPQRWALDRENPQRQGLDELESWIYGPPDSKAGGTDLSGENAPWQSTVIEEQP